MAMTGSVRAIDAMASVKESIQAMRDGGVSSLVVNRRDEHDEYGLSRALVVDHEREPVGIVTLRDMVLRAELA